MVVFAIGFVFLGCIDVLFECWVWIFMIGLFCLFCWLLDADWL